MAVVDVDYLLELARDKSKARREDLAQTITGMFDEQGSDLSERERALMFDILHKMVHEAEMGVRRIIAKQLAEIPDVPGPLINTLANDDIEVAYPILCKSPVFLDVDLIEVIKYRTMEHQLAITARQTVSEEVSDALVETASEPVIASLLKNQKATISRATMEYLIEESKRVDTFREPILRREDLEPELAKSMYLWVSAALKSFIVEKYDFDKTVLDELLNKAMAEEIDSLESRDKSPSKSEDLAAELEGAEGKPVKAMIQSLRDGQVSLFTAMFKRHTGLPEKLVKRILFEPGGEGLAIACRASGIEAKDFSSIYNLSLQARPGSGRTSNSDTQRILNFFEDLSVAAAKDVINHWQNDVDYFEAIRKAKSPQAAAVAQNLPETRNP
ncbi:MAG: DUF2336 domain-containing protein [Rhodospirillales bacterium]|nr:DUF2336 domain-containing protein [Rhodospirillales bacterium]